jgi:hypothetical protein
MISRITVILCLVGSLLLFWVGCSGRETCAKVAAALATQGLVQLGEACENDADCKSRFCDRDRCNEPDHKYGSPCAPLAPDAGPIETISLCRGYLCLSDRCRSCTADAECQSYYGMGKCRPVADAAGWPERAVCHPATTLRRNKEACTEDVQCWSLFCDRGTCRSGDPELSYGEACTPGPPKAPTHDPDAHAKGTCEGYLCVDGRCQSCQSDGECQQGSSELRCLRFGNWPGKVCVTPSDAENEPFIVVSGGVRLDLDHEAARVTPRVPPAPRSPSRCP